MYKIGKRGGREGRKREKGGRGGKQRSKQKLNGRYNLPYHDLSFEVTEILF
jgi:hypothetical protein